MLNLKEQHQRLMPELAQIILDTVETAQLLPPGRVEVPFERDVASYCGRKHVVGVGSGSSALHLVLLAFGVGPGDEVITTPTSFFATTEAILHVGATPVFTEVDSENGLMDISSCVSLINDNTKIIMPTHLYGNVFDVPELKEMISKQYPHIKIIEDCAHAFGSCLNGKRVPLGDAGAFSFNPTKNIGGISDAGAVVTDDDNVADLVKALRDHGRVEKNKHSYIGYNSRLSSLNAGVLSLKLRHIDSWNQRRREIAEIYNETVEKANGIRSIKITDGCTSSYHQYCLICDDRQRVQNIFDSHLISSAIHYPTLITHQTPIRDFYLDRPIADEFNQRCLSIPCYPELSDNDIEKITSAIESI